MNGATRTARRAVVLALAAVVALVGVHATPASAQVGIDRIDVSIKLQRAYVYGTGGELLREFPISSGARGSTPLGSYRVFRKSASTVSTSDHRVSMRWMTNFNGGIGFHGIPRKGGVALSTPLGQRAVSHGCIRMNDGDAQWIHDNVPMGTRVNVITK
jgi:lipoprotein-anchoring transpeptidase ErfK/SrfK